MRAGSLGRKHGKTAKQLCYDTALAHGLRNVEGYYGMTRDGEFVAVNTAALIVTGPGLRAGPHFTHWIMHRRRPSGPISTQAQHCRMLRCAPPARLAQRYWAIQDGN